MKRKILLAAILVLAAVIVVTCVLIGREAMRGNAEEAEFQTLSASVYVEEDVSENIHKRDLAPLFEQNSDCIGWVCIPDTVLDYPVMHTPEEPEKYLHLNFEGKYSYAGVPFLRGDLQPGNSHIILFGHNMKNGTMFATIKKYRDRDYYTEHPVVEFETAEGYKEYDVFAVVKMKKDDPWYAYEGDQENFVVMVTDVLDRSLYTTGIVPAYGKQLLTLSTCHGRTKADRIVVIAVEK